MKMGMRTGMYIADIKSKAKPTRFFVLKYHTPQTPEDSTGDSELDY